MTSLEAEHSLSSSLSVGISTWCDETVPITHSEHSTCKTTLQQFSLTNDVSPFILNKETLLQASQVEEMEMETSDVGNSNYSLKGDTCLESLQASTGYDLHQFSSISLSLDGGAGDAQPAPAVWDGMHQGHSESQFGTLDSQEAFQLVSGTSQSVSDPAGLLQCKVLGFSSPQEHFPSRNCTLLLRNSNDNKLSLQSLTVNNSATESNLLIPSSQSFPNLQESTTNTTSIQPSLTDKMLHFNAHQEKTVSSILKDAKLNDNSIHDTVNTFIPDNIMQSTMLPTTQAVSELFHKTSYANVLAPPNTKPTTTGSAPECGISVERIPGYTLEAYAWAVTDVVGKSSIAFIGRNPVDESFVLIFLKTPEMASVVVNKGIWLKSRWLNVSYYQQPAIRLTVSGVLPFLPDTLVIEALAPFGSSVYPILRRIPAAVKSLAFKGVSSFRREIYLIKKDAPIPDAVNVVFLGISHRLEISTTGAKCFNCGSLLHSVNRCKIKINSEAKSLEPTQVLLADGQSGNNTNNEDNSNSYNKGIMTISQSGKSMKTSVFANVSNTNANVASTLLNIQAKSADNTRAYFSQCNLAGLPAITMLNNTIGSSVLTSNMSGKDLLQKAGPSSEVRSLSKYLGNNSRDDSAFAVTKLSNFGTVEHSNVTESSLTNDARFPQNQVPKKKKRILLSDSGLNKTSPAEGEVPFQAAFSKDVDQLSVSDNDNDNNHKQSLDVLKVGTSLNNVNTCPKGSSAGSGLILQNKELLSYSGIQVQDAIGVVEEWCRKAKGMKPFPRKNLASFFVQNYPDLESMIITALSVPKRYPSSSFKYKRIQELLSELRLNNEVRISRVAKRKEPVVQT